MKVNKVFAMEAINSSSFNSTYLKYLSFRGRKFFRVVFHMGCPLG